MMLPKPERSLLRSSPAFFSRPETSRLIRQIAKSKRLSVYVGAGVTLSDTGLTWAALIKELLKEIQDIEPSQAQRLGEQLPVLHQASLIWEHYSKQHDDNALSQLQDKISTLIYRKNQWRSGEYSASLILMCDVLIRSGVDVSIYTTNYDTYLEDVPLRLQGSDTPVLSPVVGLTPVDVLTDDDDTDDVLDDALPLGPAIEVTHLHGVIGPRGQIQTYQTPPVFSEIDYHLSQNATVRRLTQGFSGTSVLILGSGLDDPPLLRALAETRGKTKDRWAIFPRAAARKLEPYDLEKVPSSDDIMTEVEKRMAQFNVKLVMPDFFTQASQFVREVAYARQCMDSGSEYQVRPSSYDSRLAAWWESWVALTGASSRASRQRTDHRKLMKAVDSLRKYTGDPDERLKVEAWLRWKPGELRHLQLWASSTGTWPDNRSARRVPIEEGSDYAAVQAFVAGQVLLSETAGRSHRWERYLAVPIRLHGGLDSPVVGVVTLATANVGGASKFRENQPAVLEYAVRYLRTVGRDLFNPMAR